MLEFKTIIFKKNIHILIFVFLFIKIGHTQESFLANKVYQLSKINKEVVVIADKKDIFISFTKDNSFNGYSGCNFFKGFYTEKEGSVTLKNIVTTRKICFEENIQKQEYLILQILQNVDFFSQINKNDIILKSKNDSIYLIKVKQ